MTPMAVVEYKLHAVGTNAMQAPHWMKDGGYWKNPDDHSMVGWVPDNSEFWVPDTVVTLTRAEFITRQLGIHAAHPMTESDPEDPAAEPTTLTNEQVETQAGTWYDNFHAE
jgi:hypothetical protein